MGLTTDGRVDWVRQQTHLNLMCVSLCVYESSACEEEETHNICAYIATGTTEYGYTGWFRVKNTVLFHVGEGFFMLKFLYKLTQEILKKERKNKESMRKGWRGG